MKYFPPNFLLHMLPSFLLLRPSIKNPVYSWRFRTQLPRTFVIESKYFTTEVIVSFSRSARIQRLWAWEGRCTMRLYRLEHLLITTSWLVLYFPSYSYYWALVKLYATCTAMEDVHKVVNNVHQNKQKLDTITWTTFISAAAQCGDVDAALKSSTV